MAVVGTLATPAAMAAPNNVPDTQLPPQRIVSLNVCTDQLAMLLVDHSRIMGVSHLSHRDDTSVMAQAARKLPAIQVRAEEIFIRKPDVVLTATFGTREQTDILRRLGVRVEEFPPATSFADIRANVLRMGDVLGAETRARALVADFDAKLHQLATEAVGPRLLAALYYANSYTSGSGTLAGEVVEWAGLDNLAAKIGLTGTTALPLELLVMGKPDLVIQGRRFDPPVLADDVFSHPAVMFLRDQTSQTLVADKYWVCGTPLVTEAVEMLVAARKTLTQSLAVRIPTFKDAASLPVTTE